MDTGLKIAAMTLGALCVYCGALLYEDEERKLQNRLENLWVLATDASLVTRKNLALAHLGTATVVNKLLCRAYGAMPFGRRSLWIASVLGTTASCAVIGAYDWKASVFLALGWCALVAPLMYYSRTAARPRPWILGPVLAIVPSINVLLVCSVMKWLGHRPSEFTVAWGCAATGFVVGNVVGTAVSMHALRSLVDSRRIATSTLAILIGTPVVTLAAAIGTAFITAGCGELLNIKTRGEWEGIEAVVSMAGAFGDVQAWLIVASFAILLLAAVTNAIVWNLAQRPLYGLARVGVFSHKKSLLAVGCTLIGVGIPGSETWVEKVIDLL